MNGYIVYITQVQDSLSPFIAFDSEGRKWSGITEKEAIEEALKAGVLLSKPIPEKIDSGMNFVHFTEEDTGFFNKHFKTRS